MHREDTEYQCVACKFFCLPHGRLRDASFSPPPSPPPGDICLRGVLLLQFPFHEIPHPFSVHTSEFLHLRLSILRSYVYQKQLEISHFLEIFKNLEKLNFFGKFKTFEK